MQYYTSTNQCHLFTSKGYTLIDNVSDLDSVACDLESPSFSFHEIAQEFKDAKTTIKNNIKKLKDNLEDLVRGESFIKNWCYKNCKYKEREFMEECYITLYITIPREELLQRIKNLERILMYMVKGKDGDLSVEKARARPISDFIEFNRMGFAQSIWNRTDKTPSMKYYRKENRVHCFSTDQDEDVIGVVMQLNNCNFIEALKIINQ